EQRDCRAKRKRGDFVKIVFGARGGDVQQSNTGEHIGYVYAEWQLHVRDQRGRWSSRRRLRRGDRERADRLADSDADAQRNANSDAVTITDSESNTHSIGNPNANSISDTDHQRFS